MRERGREGLQEDPQPRGERGREGLQEDPQRRDREKKGGAHRTKLGAKNFQLDKTRCIHPVKRLNLTKDNWGENIESVRNARYIFS